MIGPLEELIEQLAQGLALVEAVADEDYTGCESGADATATETAWASPGAHTRHLLDFVDCLLSGIDARRIDYTARKRRGDVEHSRERGRREIQRVLEELEGLREQDGALPLAIRPEPAQPWTGSTLARELQFVSCHVLHHHALIRMTLAHRGIEAPPQYGVAPSTLDYIAECDDGAMRGD